MKDLVSLCPVTDRMPITMKATRAKATPAIDHVETVEAIEEAGVDVPIPDVEDTSLEDMLEAALHHGDEEDGELVSDEDAAADIECHELKKGAAVLGKVKDPSHLCGKLEEALEELPLWVVFRPSEFGFFSVSCFRFLM